MNKSLRVLLCCLCAAGVVGCTTPQTHTLSGTQTPQKGNISREELRAELGKVEDSFISTMKQTVEELNAADGSRRLERTNVQMQARIVEALHAMAGQDDPIVAFLDTWGLTVRLRLYLEEGEGRTLYGKHQPLAVSSASTAESEMERIASMFLTSQRFADVKTGIYSFARQNPVHGTCANLVVYATKIKEEETGVFLRTLSLPMAPIRAMEGVDKTADAIGKFRNSADRFTNVVEQLPESTRWQMSILVDDFEESQMTQQFLKSLQEFSQSSTRLVEVLDDMPKQLRTELTTVLDESGQTQVNLQTTMKTAAETAARLEQTLREFQKTTQAVNVTTAQTKEAAVALKDASESIQKLMAMFKESKPQDANAPPAFGMRDFDTMLLNAGQTADKVAGAAARIQSAMESKSTSEVQQRLRSVIDHITWRLFQLSLAVFALVLICRHITKRFIKNA